MIDSLIALQPVTKLCIAAIGLIGGYLLFFRHFLDTLTRGARFLLGIGILAAFLEVREAAHWPLLAATLAAVSLYLKRHYLLWRVTRTPLTELMADLEQIRSESDESLEELRESSEEQADDLLEKHTQALEASQEQGLEEFTREVNKRYGK